MIHQSKMKWSEVVARNIMPTRVVSVAFKPVKKSRVKTTIVNERNVDGTIHINSSDESTERSCILIVKGTPRIPIRKGSPNQLRRTLRRETRLRIWKNTSR